MRDSGRDDAAEERSCTCIWSFSLGFLVLLAHFFTALFQRTFIPDVLLLTVLGIVIGPVLGIVSPETFGSVGLAFSTIALIVILFEGGTDLSLSQLRRSFGQTVGLTLATFFATVALVAAAVGFVSLQRQHADVRYRIEPGLQGDIVTLRFANGEPEAMDRGNELHFDDQGVHAKIQQVAKALEPSVLQIRVGDWQAAEGSSLAERIGSEPVASAFTREGTRYVPITYAAERDSAGGRLTLLVPAGIALTVNEGETIQLLDQAAEAVIASAPGTPTAPEPGLTPTMPTTLILDVAEWHTEGDDPVKPAGTGILHVTGTSSFLTTSGIGVRSVVHIDAMLAILIGCILAGTSPAVVLPLVTMMRMREGSATTVILESAIADVLSIVTTLGILQALSIGKLDTGLLVGDMVAAFVGAGLIGVLGAFMWSAIQNPRATVPQQALHDVRVHVHALWNRGSHGLERSHHRADLRHHAVERLCHRQPPVRDTCRRSIQLGGGIGSRARGFPRGGLPAEDVLLPLLIPLLGHFAAVR
ncbi:hypothetical protein FJZ36_07305 [Candidatus Poribacteria bacterium]|nr:hypothetical protein [Candidatus Poribacteria bacterium]